jgi:hypothetical protein
MFLNEDLASGQLAAQAIRHLLPSTIQGQKEKKSFQRVIQLKL